MQSFQLAGFYKYDYLELGKGELRGSLEVATDGSFEGEIYDLNSEVPQQVVRGHLSGEYNLTKLAFLKFPPKADLANLGYVLQMRTNDSLVGTYEGRWGALPLKIAYDSNYNLFVARLDLKMCLIGDNAQITLSRK